MDYSAAYLFCTLHSETDQTVTLVLRSDDSPKVYLNGELLFSKFVRRGIGYEEDEVSLSLKKAATDCSYGSTTTKEDRAFTPSSSAGALRLSVLKLPLQT